MRCKTDMTPGAIHTTNTDGDLEIVEFINKHEVKVRFLSTGTETFAISQNIREGRVKDRYKPTVHGVGFIGEGKYRSSNNGVRDAAYIVWWGILYRCYNPEGVQRHPSYLGCTISDEWLNFQCFADWYYTNKPEGDYELDKDIKSGDRRGKIYSPDTCVFVLRKTNISHSISHSYRLISPAGDVVEGFNIADFCAANSLDPSAIGRVLRGLASHHKKWTRG